MVLKLYQTLEFPPNYKIDNIRVVLLEGAHGVLCPCSEPSSWASWDAALCKGLVVTFQSEQHGRHRTTLSFSCLFYPGGCLTAAAASLYYHLCFFPDSTLSLWAMGLKCPATPLYSVTTAPNRSPFPPCQRRLGKADIKPASGSLVEI